MTEIHSPPADVGKQYLPNSQIFNDKINLVKNENPSVFNSLPKPNTSVFSNYAFVPEQSLPTPELITFDENNNYKRQTGFEDDAFQSDKADLTDIAKALGNLALGSATPSAVFPGAIVEFGGNKYLYAALTPTNELAEGNILEAGKNTTHFLSIMNKGIIFTANYGTGSVESGVPIRMLQGPIKDLPFMDKIGKAIPEFFRNGTYFSNARLGPNNINLDTQGENTFLTASLNQGLFFPVKETKNNANNLNKTKQALAIQMVQNFSPAMVENTIGVAGATVLKVIDTGTDIIAVLGLATGGIGTAATLAGKKAIKHVVINKLITELGKNITPVVGIAFRSEIGGDKELNGKFNTPMPEGAPTDIYNKVKSFFEDNQISSNNVNEEAPAKTAFDSLAVDSVLNQNSFKIDTPNADLYASNNISSSSTQNNVSLDDVSQDNSSQDDSLFEQTYIVQKGDTLSEIAEQQIGFSNYEALLEANPQITNPDFIIEGQKINIPKI